MHLSILKDKHVLGVISPIFLWKLTAFFSYSSCWTQSLTLTEVLLKNTSIINQNTSMLFIFICIVTDRLAVVVVDLEVVDVFIIVYFCTFGIHELQSTCLE